MFYRFPQLELTTQLIFAQAPPLFLTQGPLQPLLHVSLSFLENSFSILHSFIIAVSQLTKLIMVEKITIPLSLRIDKF